MFQEETNNQHNIGQSQIVEISNAFANAPFAICLMKGEDLIIKSVNNKMEEILMSISSSIDNFIGKKTTELFPALSEKGIINKIKEVYATCQPLVIPSYKVELERYGKSGSMYFHVTYQPVISNNEKYILLLANDITDAVHSRKRLEENEDNLRKIKQLLELSISAGKIGVWTFNCKTNIITWSREQEALFGLSEGQFSGKLEEFLSYIHPEDLPGLQVFKPTPEQPAFEYQFRIIRKDGQIRWLEARSQNYYSENGEMEFVSGVNIDITDQKNYQTKLEEQEARFRSLAENSPDLITRHARDFTYAYVSPIIEKYIGLKPEQMVGKSYREIGLPEELCQIFDEHLTIAFNKKSLHEMEYHSLDHSTYMYSRLMPEFNDKGEVESILIITTDITARKKMEQALLEKNDQLLKINNDLDNFIYTASHDLKAPISNIEGLLYELKDSIKQHSSDNDDALMLVDLIDKSVLRFKSTIKDLTEITKVQKSAIEDFDEIEINQVLEDIILSIPDKIAEADGLIHSDFKSANKIKFSKKNFKSILFNLLSNALKYRHPERRCEINIETSANENHIILLVADNGLGFSKENQTKMFTMFKRFHDHVEGTGIGLYIIKRIMDNAGGKIEVGSEEGKGTNFKLYFPL
ncbi:MAG: PAS domain S-box protein [Cytophagaceae bacterium]